MWPCASPLVAVKMSLAGAGAYPDREGRADEDGRCFLTGDCDWGRELGRERAPWGRSP
jgi:hypothetical protein